jgi:hypothetical protein
MSLFCWVFGGFLAWNDGPSGGFGGQPFTVRSYSGRIGVESARGQRRELMLSGRVGQIFPCPAWLALWLNEVLWVLNLTCREHDTTLTTMHRAGSTEQTDSWLKAAPVSASTEHGLRQLP